MQRRHGILKTAATVLATYAGTAGLTAVLTLVLVRVLGPEEFGVFSLAMGVAGLMALAMDFGIANSLSRFMAEQVGDRRALAAFLAGATRMKLVFGGVVVVALAVFAGPIANAYDEPSLEWPLRALAIATLLQSLVLQYSGAFFAVGEAGANLQMIITESVFELAASVSFVVVGAGAAGAAWGRAYGYAVGAAIGIALSVRLFGWGSTAVHRRGGRGMATMGRYALWLWLVNGAYVLFTQIDVLVIGAILGPAAVGAFSAPLRLTALLAYPALALSNAITPRLGKRDGEAPDPAVLERGFRWLMVIQGAMVAPLVVWAAPLVDLLLGDDYAASVGVMRAMSGFVFLQGLATLTSLAANYLGEAPRRL